jgi:arylsulfatase A-like enzyme
VIDLLPTILDVTGQKAPAARRGVKCKPLQGASIRPTFASATAATRTEQYFELGGQRAFYAAPFRLVKASSRCSACSCSKTCAWTLVRV